MAANVYLHAQNLSPFIAAGEGLPDGSGMLLQAAYSGQPEPLPGKAER